MGFALTGSFQDVTHSTLIVIFINCHYTIMESTDCKPPKCHNTKRGCRCPNPWVEYLTKTALERKENSLKPLSLQKLAARYRKLKASQAFEGKSEVCNSNYSLLCNWNAQRKKHRSVPSRVSIPTRSNRKPSNSVNNVQSILPRFPLDNRNDIRPDFFANEFAKTPFFLLWFPRIQNLLPNFRFSGVLRGSSGDRIFLLMQEKITFAYLLIRLSYSDKRGEGNALVSLAQTVNAQIHFEQKLGIHVPRVHFIYDLVSKDDSITIIGTDTAQGTLDDLLNHRRKSINLLSVAAAVKVLLTRLRQTNLVHCDMGFNNITYRLSPDGQNVDFLGLIDFELSRIGNTYKYSVDEINVLVQMVNKKLLKPLYLTDYPFPEWFRHAARQSNFASIIENLDDSTAYHCGNNFEGVHIPKIHVT